MSALLRTVTLTFNGDAYEVFLEPYANGIVINKILCFANNKNVVGVEVNFESLDRSTRRAIVRAVNKHFKKTLHVKKHDRSTHS